MDERRTIGSRLGGRSTRAARSGRRRGPLLAAGLVVLAVVGLVIVGVFGGSPEAAARQQQVPPGLQPPVQGWLKDREGDLIELNNALVPFVQKQVKDPAAAQKACTRLARVAHSLSARSAVPGPRPEIDAAARAGLAKFEQAATTCLAGDVPAAERLVTEGLAERTAAQDRLDALLDGE